MLLKKEYISKDTMREFFPMLTTDNEQYKYIIEVSALRIQGRKTVQCLHISATREKDDGEFIMRELFMNAPCLRAYLDKPMRESQRERIYAEARTKLLERARNSNLSDSHPYVKTLEAM